MKRLLVMAILMAVLLSGCTYIRAWEYILWTHQQDKEEESK